MQYPDLKGPSRIQLSLVLLVTLLTSPSDILTLRHKRMMATIEPRLVHLLNDSTSGPADIDLPPSHILPLHTSFDSPASSGASLPFTGENSPRFQGREDERHNDGNISSTAVQSLRLQQNEMSKILNNTLNFSDDASPPPTKDVDAASPAIEETQACTARDRPATHH